MRYPAPALWRVEVERVHDGDTIEVLMDRGFGDTSVKPIRLKDVYAPELGQMGGLYVKNFVEAWLFTHTHEELEWAFSLLTYRTPRSDVEAMTFTRYLGRLACSQGHSLNDAVKVYVLENGYAGGTGS